MKYFPIALLFVALLSRCGTTDGGDKDPKYAGSAQQNYERGLEELKDENYPAALKYFNMVRTKFPFSKYAVLAELRLADTQFQRARYTDAIDEYKVFERAHPTHESVESGYVGFRVCEGYYKQIPDDFFLMPPSYEKDQAPTREALREFDAFLARWPNSKYQKKARQYRQDAVLSLAQSELYVARFYLKRGKVRAAAWRLETLVKQYSGSPVDPQALLLLGDVYQKLGELDKARQAWSRLVNEHKGAVEAPQAQGRLQKLGPGTPARDQHG